MCGRNSLFIELDELEDFFDSRYVSDEPYTPRYNIAPGAKLEVIPNDRPNAITKFHWGLIPFWADEPEEGIINARSETVGNKAVFQDAWESRPCLVLSSGFYEWHQRPGGPKQPFRIYRESTPGFAMAGIWDVWEGESQRRPSVSILTTEPNELMAPIHNRMPVILPREHESTWLTAGPEQRASLCQPYPKDDLARYEISTAVNDPTNDTATVVEPLDHQQSGLDSFS